MSEKKTTEAYALYFWDCPYCNESSEDGLSYSDFDRIHHKERSRQVTCDDCGETFDVTIDC